MGFYPRFVSGVLIRCVVYNKRSVPCCFKNSDYRIGNLNWMGMFQERTRSGDAFNQAVREMAAALSGWARARMISTRSTFRTPFPTFGRFARGRITKTTGAI